MRGHKVVWLAPPGPVKPATAAAWLCEVPLWPGQAVVIPAGWWHEVDNDPNTLAFAFDLVHA